MRSTLVTPEHPDWLKSLPPGLVANPFSVWNGHSKSWPEAEVIANPVKRSKKSEGNDEPVVLVRRKTGQVRDMYDNDVVCIPGMPVISLFTGAGGMDLGLEPAGFCSMVQHEWDNNACDTLIGNRPNYFRHSALIQGDIRKTPTSMLLKEAGLRVGEAALVCGGPPCQGFTTANSKSGKGTYDYRNDLMFEFVRVVRESQPAHFCMENVPGFQHFPGKYQGKSYFEAVLAAFYAAYYEIVYGLIDACDHGVPQKRVRFIAMGTRRDLFECDGKLASLPAPTNFQETDLKTIRMLEGGLFEKEYETLTHAPGIRYFPDRPVLQTPRPNDGNNGRSETFIKFYAKLRETEPDRIVLAPRGRD